MKGIVGATYALAGRASETRRMLEELKMDIRKMYIPPTSFAWIHFALGEIDQCLDWLEKAVDDQDGWITFIQADDYWSPIRSHPRYRALLRKMNLE